jgi:DNA-binding transcriptional MerR regulator
MSLTECNDRPVTDQLVSSAKAAQALNVHPSTLRRWIESGIVTPKSRTAGGHARWDLEELQRQVAEHLARGGS